MKKTAFVLLLLAVATALALTACGRAAAGRGGSGDTAGQAAAPAAALSVTDLAGNRVELAAPAVAVVALNAGDCEIAYALGAGTALIGRGEYCDYPREARDLPQLQTGDDLNIEQLAALKPDLVLASRVFQSQEQIDALVNAGLTVAISEADTIEQVYGSIAMIGALLGREAAAAALVGEMRQAFAAIAPPAGQGGQTVYFEVSPLEWGLWTAGTGTFMDEIARMMGLANIFADVAGWTEVSQEQVLERNPDYIVTVTMYYGDGPTPDQEIMSRPGWEQVRAVAEQRIYCADSDSITRPGPRLMDAARDLYAFVYGD